MDPSLLEELRLLTSQWTLHHRSLSPSFPDIVITSASSSTEPLPHVAESMFSIVVQGGKHVGLGKRSYDYRAGQYLVVSIDLPVVAHVVEATPEVPFLGIGIAIKPEIIAALLIESKTNYSGQITPIGIGTSDLTDDLVDPVIRLLRLLNRPDDIPVLASAIEREIHWRLINGQQGMRVSQIGLADSRLVQISRAIRYIRDHYAETFRIEELADIVSMSVTSFHRHFRAVTSLTPIQYQKHIRLQAARSLLVTKAEEVSSVAFAVGYDSPSQFSREYRRMFGAPPGIDGARLRQSEEISEEVFYS